MKKMHVFSGLILALLLSFSSATMADEKPTVPENPLGMPENVKAVVDRSCFGCHNSDSRNEDAKEDLDFKTLADLSVVKKIGKFNDIKKVLDKGEMPPKKYLERNPHKKLTEEETQLLTDWVKQESAKLIGQ